jgi:hypothetical protein
MYGLTSANTMWLVLYYAHVYVYHDMRKHIKQKYSYKKRHRKPPSKKGERTKNAHMHEVQEGMP